jgi:hypothetical protein
MAEPTPEVPPLPRAVDAAGAQTPEAAGSRKGTRAIGVFAFVALIAASIVSIGLASIVWVPLLLGLGIAMAVIAAARRRRQSMEGRDGNEIKDPTHAHPSWPTRGVIDDRLPEP